MLEHRFDINITENDFNEGGSVKLSSLLFFFQEAAAQHAEVIGIGMEALLKKNIIWVLTKMKVRILKEPAAGEGYYVMTYPRAVKSRFCPRDYYLYNKDNELIVVASAMWSLVDWTTRKVVRATDLDFGGEFREDAVFPEGFEKFRIRDARHVKDYIVTPDDIDVNQHTNNCRYADMVSMTTDISPVREFIIQFSKETKEGDMILLSVEDVEDGQMIGGSLADGQAVFSAKVTIEKQ